MALEEAWVFLKAGTNIAYGGNEPDQTHFSSLTEDEQQNPLDFMSPSELNELGTFGSGETFDPDIVFYYLGHRKPLSEEEATELTWRGIKVQEEQGEASHPEGISHPDNIREYEKETGRGASSWGLGPPMHVRGRVLGQEIDHTFDADDNPSTLRKPSPHDTVSPKVIGNMAWPFWNITENDSGDFSSTNKAIIS